MPTFGYTSAPATSQTNGSPFGYCDMGGTYVASSGDQLDSVSCYCKATSGTRNSEVAVYDVSGSAPNARLALGNITADTTAQWQTATGLATAMVASTEYTPSFWNSGSAIFTYYYDSGSAGDASYDADTTGGLPATFTQESTLSRRYGVYGTYSTSGDTTAPILSSPTGTKTGSTTASGTVTTDEGNGTLYFTATTNTSETAATIKTGSSQAVTATGSQAVSFTGLTPSTTYYAHYVHDDAATNESNVVSSASFTTDAASSFNPAWAYNTSKLIGGM